MGIKERKEKEKERLKSLILEGAMKLFLEEGIENTTIRNIAKEIDYSPATVYLYFKDKNAILHELHRQGFQLMSEKFKVLMSVRNPMERLWSIGYSYLDFAQNSPGLYDLMFNMKAPLEYIESQQKSQWHEGRASFGLLKQTIQECAEEGHFEGHLIEPLAFSIWGTVHGICSLLISQRIKGVVDAEPVQILKDSYEEFMRMVEKA